MNSITLIENEIKRQISFESDIAHLLNFHGLIFMSGTSFFYNKKEEKNMKARKLRTHVTMLFLYWYLNIHVIFCFHKLYFFLSFIYINIKTMTLRQNMCLILVKFCVSYSWWTLRILVIKYFKSNMLFLNMYFNITWKKKRFSLVFNIIIDVCVQILQNGRCITICKK